MQFGPVDLDAAQGKILAHNLSGPDGVRLHAKGRVLTRDDIDSLRQHGISSVYVAWLDPDDVAENAAAERVAAAVGKENVVQSRSNVGRVNLRANSRGVLRIDTSRLDKINAYDGIAVATLAGHSIVLPRQVVATVKIIPFGVPERTLVAIEAIAANGPVIHVSAMQPTKVGMIICGSPALRERLFSDFHALEDRVTALGSQVTETAFVDLSDPMVESRLAETLGRMRESGVTLILIAGETAIMHRNDTIPRGVERAGGSIECVGAPVEPGNLLMLAYLDDIAVLGAPGCARSPKANVVDQVIPRLLAGERVTRPDIVKLAVGGLLAG